TAGASPRDQAFVTSVAARKRSSSLGLRSARTTRTARSRATRATRASTTSTRGRSFRKGELREQHEHLHPRTAVLHGVSRVFDNPGTSLRWMTSHHHTDPRLLAAQAAGYLARLTGVDE